MVHHRTRLGILAILREVDRAEFGYLRDALGLTDGNLSRHLRTLQAAGHIEVHKGYQGNRPRTWLRLTRQGAGALDQEVAALRALVDRLDGTPRTAHAGVRPRPDLRVQADGERQVNSVQDARRGPLPSLCRTPSVVRHVSPEGGRVHGSDPRSWQRPGRKGGNKEVDP